MAKGGKQKLKPQSPQKNGHAVGKKAESPVEEADTGQIEPIIPAGAEWHVALATSIFVSVYVKCTAASIPSGDAGDFILSAYHFGVAHPPGYPLYVTLGYLWMKLLPFGNPAYKLNLLTSIIGGLAASTIYLTTYKITKYIPSAIFASGVFGFSHLIWFHSVGAEIFSLNNAFCSVLLLWVVRFQQAPVANRAKVAIEASFISGLSMCNQHTSGLFIAVIGGWMFLSLLRDKAITVHQFLQTGVAFAIALIPYIQLPLSAYFATAPSTWGDQRSLKGMWTHITREEYGTFRLTADDSAVGDLVSNLHTYTEDLVHELGVLTLLLTVVCVLSAYFYPTIRTIVYVYMATVFGYIMFFCMQANIDHTRNLMKGVLERFWMQSNIVVSMLSGCGIWCIYTPLANKLPRAEKVITVLATAATLAITLNQIMINYTVCDLSNNLIMRDYGKKLLDATPRSSVLMVEGDMPSLTSRYLRYCENYREDIDVVDQELIGFPWFKPMHKHVFKHYIFPYDRELYYKQVLARKGENYPFSYNFADVFHIHLQNRVPLHIYPFTKHGDEDWKQSFELWPINMIYTVKRMSEPYEIEEFLELAYVADHDNENLLYCDNTLYPIRSWEYVIAEACGHTAFFPPEHAHRLLTAKSLHDTAEGEPLLLKTFKLYTRAYMELTRLTADGTLKHYFGVDHLKNYGVISYLIYTRYRRIGKTQEAAGYARVMIEQWEHYFAKQTKNTNNSQDNSLRSVIADAKQNFPDLMTNPAYELQI